MIYLGHVAPSRRSLGKDQWQGGLTPAPSLIKRQPSMIGFSAPSRAGHALTKQMTKAMLPPVLEGTTTSYYGPSSSRTQIMDGERDHPSSLHENKKITTMQQNQTKPT